MGIRVRKNPASLKPSPRRAGPQVSNSGVCIRVRKNPASLKRSLHAMRSSTESPSQARHPGSKEPGLIEARPEQFTAIGLLLHPVCIRVRKNPASLKPSCDFEIVNDETNVGIRVRKNPASLKPSAPFSGQATTSRIRVRKNPASLKFRTGARFDPAAPGRDRHPGSKEPGLIEAAVLAMRVRFVRRRHRRHPGSKEPGLIEVSTIWPRRR